MKHRIHITAIPNQEPDLERFVAALLAFVLARREAEAKERAEHDREGGDG